MSFGKGPSAAEMARAQEDARAREEARLSEQQRIADAHTLQNTLDLKTRQANAEAGAVQKIQKTQKASILSNSDTSSKKSLLSNYSQSL